MKQSALGILMCVAAMGCACPTHLTVSNNSPDRLLVDVSMPYPGFGLLREHCQFSVLMEPGETWDSLETNRQDRIELPIGPHGGVIIRVINLDVQRWPHAVYSIDVETRGRIRFDGTWDELRVTAVDRHGDERQVRLQEDRRWFKDQRARVHEDDDAALHR